MPLADANLESKKPMCVVHLDFVYGSQQTLECIAKGAKIQDLTPLDDYDQPLSPHVWYRVSGKSTNHVASDMKSTLESAEVMVRYLLAKEKLMKDLKLVIREDHHWHLWSSDHNHLV